MMHPEGCMALRMRKLGMYFRTSFKAGSRDEIKRNAKGQIRDRTFSPPSAQSGQCFSLVLMVNFPQRGPNSEYFKEFF